MLIDGDRFGLNKKRSRKLDFNSAKNEIYHDRY